MGDVATGILGVLECIPKIAFQISIPLVFLGGGLMMGVGAEFIPKTAFHGYVADAAPVLVTIGVATLSIGVAVAVFSWLSKIPAAMSARGEWQNKRTKLYQNMNFLPADHLFVLLNMLNQPGCRCPSHGEIPTIRTLEKYDLISSENFYGAATDAGAMIQVAPALIKDLKKAKKTVRQLLQGRGNDQENLVDDQVVANRALKVLNGERLQESQRRQGF